MINYITKYPIIGVSVFITLMPIILMLFRGEIKKPSRIFFYFLLSKFTFDIYGKCLASNSINSLLICNIWVLVSFIFISAIFYHIFVDDFSKKLIIVLVAIFSILFVYDIIDSNESLSDLNNHRYTMFSPVLRSALILGYCMMFYWELIQELYIDEITKSLIFWMVCSLFIYHSVCVMAESINHFYLKWGSDDSLLVIAYMPYIFEVVMMLIYSIAIYYTKEKPQLKEEAI